MKDLQKTRHTGHRTHTPREALIQKHKTFNMGNNITCTINRNYRTAATLCTYPRNMVCFRYIIVNTVHKGDKKDDNNNNNLIQGGAKVA